MSTLTARSTRRARWAGVAVLTALATTVLTLPASAVPAPATAMPTASTGTAAGATDPDELSRLCRDRLPIIQARAAHLIEVLEGGPDVVGSVEWLRANADTAEANGRPERAQLLRARADLRATRADDIARVVQRLEDAAATYCTDVP